MKNKIISLLEKVTLKSSIIVTFIFLAVLWIIDYSPIGVAGMLKVSNGVNILDYETRYSVNYAYDWLERMGEAGRNFHLTKVMPLDIIFPPCFMLFMFSWTSLLAKKAFKKDSIFRTLPALAIGYMLLDWIENIGITAMLVNYPRRLCTICVATGWVTSIKKTFILFVITFVIIELIAILVKGLKGELKCQD